MIMIMMMLYVLNNEVPVDGIECAIMMIHLSLLSDWWMVPFGRTDG